MVAYDSAGNKTESERVRIRVIPEQEDKDEDEEEDSGAEGEEATDDGEAYYLPPVNRERYLGPYHLLM